MGLKLTGKKCRAMEGLIEEGKEVLESEAEGAILDLAISAAAQRVEHYEVSAYGSARTLAEQMGHGEAAGLLAETLDEESAADERLTQIAEEDVFPQALEGEEGGEGEEGSGEEETSAKARGKGRRKK